MKNKIVLLTFLSISSLNLIGVITKIDPQEIKKVAGNLRKFHETTRLDNVSQKPELINDLNKLR